MEIEIGIEFKQRSIIATLRWGREEKWKGSGESERGVRCDKPNALLTLEHFLLLPLESSQGGRHRRLARFDALISYLVCCLYLFCRLGERMHPSRMKSCCQQGASDCKLCKLRCATAVFIQWVQIVCPQVFVCWPRAMRQQESVL